MIPFQTKKANGDNLFCGEVEKLGDWVLCMPNIVFAYVAFLILFILISLQMIQEPSVENLSRVVTNMMNLLISSLNVN